MWRWAPQTHYTLRQNTTSTMKGLVFGFTWIKIVRKHYFTICMSPGKHNKSAHPGSRNSYPAMVISCDSVWVFGVLTDLHCKCLWVCFTAASSPIASNEPSIVSIGKASPLPILQRRQMASTSWA